MVVLLKNCHWSKRITEQVRVEEEQLRVKKF